MADLQPVRHHAPRQRPRGAGRDLDRGHRDAAGDGEAVGRDRGAAGRDAVPSAAPRQRSDGRGRPERRRARGAVRASTCAIGPSCSGARSRCRAGACGRPATSRRWVRASPRPRPRRCGRPPDPSPTAAPSRPTALAAAVVEPGRIGPSSAPPFLTWPVRLDIPRAAISSCSGSTRRSATRSAGDRTLQQYTRPTARSSPSEIEQLPSPWPDHFTRHRDPQPGDRRSSRVWPPGRYRLAWTTDPASDRPVDRDPDPARAGRHNRPLTRVPVSTDARPRSHRSPGSGRSARSPRSRFRERGRAADPSGRSARTRAVRQAKAPTATARTIPYDIVRSRATGLSPAAYGRLTRASTEQRADEHDDALVGERVRRDRREPGLAAAPGEPGQDAADEHEHGADRGEQPAPAQRSSMHRAPQLPPE